MTDDPSDERVGLSPDVALAARKRFAALSETGWLWVTAAELAAIRDAFDTAVPVTDEAPEVRLFMENGVTPFEFEELDDEDAKDAEEWGYDDWEMLEQLGSDD